MAEPHARHLARAEAWRTFRRLARCLDPYRGRVTVAGATDAHGSVHVGPSITVAAGRTPFNVEV